MRFTFLSTHSQAPKLLLVIAIQPILLAAAIAVQHRRDGRRSPPRRTSAAAAAAAPPGWSWDRELADVDPLRTDLLRDMADEYAGHRTTPAAAAAADTADVPRPAADVLGGTLSGSGRSHGRLPPAAAHLDPLAPEAFRRTEPGPARRPPPKWRWEDGGWRRADDQLAPPPQLQPPPQPKSDPSPQPPARRPRPPSPPPARTWDSHAVDLGGRRRPPAAAADGHAGMSARIRQAARRDPLPSLHAPPPPLPGDAAAAAAAAATGRPLKRLLITDDMCASSAAGRPAGGARSIGGGGGGGSGDRAAMPDDEDEDEDEEEEARLQALRQRLARRRPRADAGDPFAPARRCAPRARHT